MNERRHDGMEEIWKARTKQYMRECMKEGMKGKQV